MVEIQVEFNGAGQELLQAELTRFRRDGFIGPIPLLTRAECRALNRHLDNERRPLPADWHKGGAVTDWLLFRLAANPRLLELLTPILGEDIVLWGCSIVRRRPGEAHPWHVDIETSTLEGRYASAWIGIENTRRNSGLEFVAGSHAVGTTIQQVQAERGCRRGEASTDTVLGWAREESPRAELIKPELQDGEAVLFDGHIWHGSRNDHGSRTRSALLLQFASADSPVRMHDHAKLEWPFKFVNAPKPPTIVVHGAAANAPNRVVAPPPIPTVRKRMPMLSTCIRSLDLPLEERPEGGWQPHNLFRGPTRILDDMKCHAAVLSAGHSPHPPHSHAEEELLIVLDGEAELLIADRPSYDGARVEHVARGAFAYYPAFQHHTIRNPGPGSLTYLMFKWHVDGAKPAANPLGTTVFRFGDAQPQGGKGFVTEKLFERPTAWLGRLQCHTTRLAPGARYAPHVDAYDVAILMLSGRVETLGQEVGPHGVVYYAAGEEHGMRNIGDEPAHYLVFEFQASAVDLRQRLRRRVKPIAKRVLKRTARTFGVDLHRLRAGHG
jgi:quercetin dioxygenase-like cupin family protein